MAIRAAVRPGELEWKEKGPTPVIHVGSKPCEIYQIDHNTFESLYGYYSQLKNGVEGLSPEVEAHTILNATNNTIPRAKRITLALSKNLEFPEFFEQVYEYIANY
jgi:hypothetical protein